MLQKKILYYKLIWRPSVNLWKGIDLSLLVIWKIDLFENTHMLLRLENYVSIIESDFLVALVLMLLCKYYQFKFMYHIFFFIPEYKLWELNTYMMKPWNLKPLIHFNLVLCFFLKAAIASMIKQTTVYKVQLVRGLRCILIYNLVHLTVQNKLL